jgi:predicted small metal-binding protein
MQHEVADQQTGLSAPELLVDAPAVDFDGKEAAQLDANLVCQGRAKIRPRQALYKPLTEEVQMAKQINCECGFVAHGGTETEVIARIRDHMRSDHPDLLAKVSDDDLRGWIEET